MVRTSYHATKSNQTFGNIIFSRLVKFFRRNVVMEIAKTPSFPSTTRYKSAVECKYYQINQCCDIEIFAIGDIKTIIFACEGGSYE